MSYNISSEKFTHPLLKPILLELSDYFKEAGISFFVIGATARDILMELHNVQSGRLTYDLDIAITVNDWKQWLIVEEQIVNLKNFTKDEKQRQRFLYKGNFQLDIVPFGEIMKSDYQIFWPPNEEVTMSVLGFAAADESALTIIVDNETEIKIAPLTGIFLLKVIAWKDRNLRNNKDADDIGFILENYLSIHLDRAVDKYYDEIYESQPHTPAIGGAFLLGVDINELLVNHPETTKSILETLNEELNKKEGSKLINQIIETHKSLSYEEVLTCVQSIVNGLNHK